jgi:hypothetical protein
MGPSDLLRRLAETLERLQIPYLVTGSTATIAYGEPRFTQDIDVVIDLRSEKVAAFCESFPEPDFYCPLETVRESVRTRFPFNVLHLDSGLKIDLIPATESEFDRSRFSRATRVKVGPNIDAWFASPEDVILKKLLYYQEGGSDKHLRDIGGVLKVRAEQLDRHYVSAWAERLGVTSEWEAVLGAAESAE